MILARHIAVRLAAALVIVLAAGCAIIPLDGNNPTSHSLPGSTETRIAQRLQLDSPPLSDDQASAVRLQITGYQAWEDRLRLFQLADRSLDIQYFTWGDDESSLVLMSHVIDAADRGVRVRLLLDDMMAVNQAMLVRVDAHENIEVRLFNPFSTQRVDILVRPFEWLFKDRLNVRMHNKVIIVDSLVGMVGGRNIANRYFWLDAEFNHRDLDAVVIGAVIPHLQTSFDDYWNSPWSVPMNQLESPPKPRQVRKYYKALQKLRDSETVTAQFAAAAPVELAEYNITAGMQAARIEFIADSPDKVVNREPSQFNYLDTLIEEQVERELLVGMAYMVSSESIMDQATRLTQRGVEVAVLTNSLVSIDFPAAFSGYVSIRSELIDLGVDVYEYAVDASYRECAASCAGTHMGFHSKLLVLDRKISYVGSMNYDPRSIDLNTEAGLVIYSETVADQVAAVFYRDAGTANSWHVTHNSPMRWSRPGPDGVPEERDSEPDANILNWLGVKFWGVVPLGDQY